MGGVVDGAGVVGVGVGLVDAGWVEPGGGGGCPDCPAGEVAVGGTDVWPGAPVFADGVAGWVAERDGGVA